MIVRPNLHWFRMIFVLRGSVLRDILQQLAITTGFAIIVTLCHGSVFTFKVPLTFVPFSLIGLTLAIFLGFRNSTSYARFWEARNLWGEILNATRTLARQSLTLPDDATHAPAFVRKLIAFTHALRHQLRGTDPGKDLARLLEPHECERVANAHFKPAVLLLMAGEWLRDMRERRLIQPVLIPAMEEPLNRLSEALGGCERIAGTPIPFTYAVIIHRVIYLYCFLLPFGLLDSIHGMTPVVVAFIAYTFFALEALSAEIEDPFGTEQNDLPLDALSWTIEATLRETLGEREFPPKPESVHYVLT
ncbi:MAG TPA: bestrophin family ion channel [Pararobbsia sp.]|nr:bestrophin family ion channel [Pararobbsia sp.]